MFGLTLKETIILIVALSLIISLVLGIFKHSIKLIGVMIVLAILFSGFTWLPEQIRHWIYTGKDDSVAVDPNMQYNNLNDTINDVGTAVGDFVNENKGSWIVAGKSLWNKIQGGEGYTN